MEKSRKSSRVAGLVLACGVLLLGGLAFFLLRGERRGAPEPDTARTPVESAPEPSELPRAASPKAQASEAAREPAPSVEVPSSKRAGPKLTARVVDPARTALAGVRVRAFEGEVLLGEGRSGVDGGVELAGVPRAEKVLWLAEREGFVHVRAERPAGERAVLVLRPVARLTGRVVDVETKAALPGAVVEHAHLSCSKCPLERAVTDADGRYELEVASGAAEESLRFTLRAAGYRSLAASFVAREPGAALTRDFELLPRRPETHGRVIDLVTGAPLSDARVVLGADTLGVEADGSFSSTRTTRLDLPPERRGSSDWLIVHAPGHCNVSLRTNGDEWPVVIPLPPVASLVGHVRDTEGRPLAARLVLDQSEDPDVIGTPLERLPRDWVVRGLGSEALTDAQGRYRIDGILPWYRQHVLHVAANGYEQVAWEKITPAQPGEELVLDVTLTETRGPSIHGALTLNGRPAPGIVAWRRGEFENGRVEVQDGRYRIDGLPSGEIQLTAFPGERAVDDFVPAARVVVRLAEGQELQHDFALELASATISGRVGYADGTPAARLELRVQMEGRSWFEMLRTDELGRFHLRVPDCGFAFELSLQDGGVRQIREGVPAGAEGVDFVLPAMGRILHRAVARGGPRAVTTYWSWRVAGKGEYEALQVRGADAQGFLLARLPVGRIDLHANGGPAGFRSETRLDLVVLADGEPERVTFELEPGLTLEIRLVPGQRPPPNAYIVLPPEELWADLSCTRNERGNNTLSFGGRHPGTSLTGLSFDGSGHARLRGLAPGRYRFKAFHESLTFDPEVIEVRPFEVDPEGGVETQRFQVRWSLDSR